jgi:hypothetical protein
LFSPRGGPNVGTVRLGDFFGDDPSGRKTGKPETTCDCNWRISATRLIEEVPTGTDFLQFLAYQDLATPIKRGPLVMVK